MTHEELERAVERVTASLAGIPIKDKRVMSFDSIDPADLRALLSERAELLAAVERMRGALMAAQSFIADGGLAETDPGASIYRQVTAALTTGEGK